MGTNSASSTPASVNRIGYARVSTADQQTALQLDALAEAGCHRVFVDHASGAVRDRPELARALDHLRPGDTLVVWRLDRLGRSVKNLVDLMGELAEREVAVHSLREQIDTSTAAGRLITHIFAALAEMERDLIRERTVAGLAAARARGRVGGRRPVLTGEKLRVARDMYESKQYTVSAIASALGVSRASVYRHVASDEPRPLAATEHGGTDDHV